MIVITDVYIGFSVADGRPKVIAVEVRSPPRSSSSPRWHHGAGVAGLAGLRTSQGLLAAPNRFVAHTRWWPPFCATVDWVAAAALAAAIMTGVDFR